MKPDQIVHRNPVTVFYARIYGDYQMMPQYAWGRLMAYAKRNNLLDPETEYFGVARDNPDQTPIDRLRYDACIAIPGEGPVEEGIDRQVLEGGTYAEFTHRGPYEGLGETFNRIFTDWFPNSGLRLTGGPSLCQYVNPEAAETPESLVTKIYIPLDVE